MYTKALLGYGGTSHFWLWSMMNLGPDGVPCRGGKKVRICSAECPSPPKCRPSMQLRKQGTFKEWAQCHVQPKQISDLTHSNSIRQYQTLVRRRQRCLIEEGMHLLSGCKRWASNSDAVELPSLPIQHEAAGFDKRQIKVKTEKLK